MKKLSKVALVAMAALMALSFVACGNLDVTSSYGSISGVAQFKDSSDNSGIVVSIEKVNGSKTESVSRSIESGKVSRSILASTVTDKNGNFLFENVEAGVYTVYASTPDNKLGAVSTKVIVEAGKQTRGLFFSVDEYGYVDGYVTIDGNETGNGGILVYVPGTSFMAKTDDSGYFKMYFVVNGSYKMAYEFGNYTYYSDEVFTVSSKNTTTLSSVNVTTSEINAGVRLTYKDGVLTANGKEIVKAHQYFGSYGDDEIEEMKADNFYWIKEITFSNNQADFANASNGTYTFILEDADKNEYVVKINIRGIKNGIGDIVLSDGTVVPAQDFYKYNGSAKPMGIITKCNNGKKVIVGVVTANLAWAPKNTFGYTYSWKDEFNVTNTYNGTAYVWGGNIDGSNNWELIKAADPDGAKNAATNYPAMNFANNYASKAGISNKSYTSGWYIPSFMETPTELAVVKSFEVLGVNLINSKYWVNYSDGRDTNTMCLPTINKFDTTSGSGDKAEAHTVLVIHEFND